MTQLINQMTQLIKIASQLINIFVQGTVASDMSVRGDRYFLSSINETASEINVLFLFGTQAGNTTKLPVLCTQFL